MLAEMVSEVALRRGRCWQTRSVVQAGMGWGALRRRLQAPQAQESGEALVWDPVLQEAGLVGARWTQVGAVELGCVHWCSGAKCHQQVGAQAWIRCWY